MNPSNWGRKALLLAAGYQDPAKARLVFETTNLCTRDCPVCGAARSVARVGRGIMDFRVFAGLAGEAQNLGTGMICLHAHGEPLLHPAIVDMVGLLSAKGLQSHLASNGDPLTPELMTGLNRAGLSELVISHPALDADNFQACTGRAWSQSLDQGLMNCLDHWDPQLGKLSIRCLVMSPSRDFIRATVPAYLQRWLTHPAVHEVEFHLYQPWPRLVLETEITGIYKRRRACEVLATGLTVLWNGDMTPCSFDVHGQLRIGTYPEMALAEAFNHSRLCRMRLRDFWRRGANPAPCPACLLPRISAPLVRIGEQEAPSGKADIDASWCDRTARRVAAGLLAKSKAGSRISRK